MSVSGVGATPESPKGTSESTNKQEEKTYSIFDNAPQDGTVSTEEQKAAFLASELDNRLIKACKYLKINLSEFFNNFAGQFRDIKTDGSADNADLANKVVELRIAEFKIKLAESIIDKFEGKEKEPPSIKTDDGLTSSECMNYLIDKIVNMGLDLNKDILVDVLSRYDYDLSGEDSIVSQKELYNVDYTSKYMNHDFEGNIKDTHALDYIINVYAERLNQDKAE